jgi:ATP-binding cassette subfamily C protein LapB
MKELLQRLMARPGIFVELLVATVFISVLALANSIFVMQVLNRYVSQGVDSTLITLTVGVFIAIFLELAFRHARMLLAQRVSARSDEELNAAGFSILTKARIGSLERVAPDMRREIVAGANNIEQAYNASNITSVLDVPFALFFVFVLYLLSPIVSLIVLGFIIAVFVGGVLGAMSMADKNTELTNASGVASALLGTAIRESETVRAFNAGEFLRGAWNKHSTTVHGLKRLVTLRQGMIQSLTQSANGMMSVFVIVAAGILVVRGEMDVGVMIGANILAARALQPISKFSQMGSTFNKAKQSIDLLREFSKMPLEKDRGSALTGYQGGLELRDVSFTYHGSNDPLFESVDLKLEPGSVLVVTGDNGTGKTTFARLILGLLDPTRGQVLADGLDLQQAASEWWRKQIIYLPQEPSLLNATILENLTINNPDADMELINKVIDDAGLRKFVDESENGLETQILDNGWRLSEGIRRRLALARGLMTGGKLVLFDEPIESFDADGIRTVHSMLSRLAQDKHTIIVTSHDPKIVKGQHTVLDINQKPVPRITTVPGVVPTQADESGDEPGQELQAGE